jgi:hypothetical protein
VAAIEAENQRRLDAAEKERERAAAAAAAQEAAADAGKNALPARQQRKK